MVGLLALGVGCCRSRLSRSRLDKSDLPSLGRDRFTFGGALPITAYLAKVKLPHFAMVGRLLTVRSYDGEVATRKSPVSHPGDGPPILLGSRMGDHVLDLMVEK